MSEKGDCRDDCPITEWAFCERHKCYKTAALAQLCRERDNYWRDWEAGHGPGQFGEPPKVPANGPPLRTRVRRYGRAVRRWLRAGKPTRTNEEVAAIYRDHCLTCKYRDPRKGTCKLCGCRVCGKDGAFFTFLGLSLPAKARAMLNKIRMGTEHCPRNKW